MTVMTDRDVAKLLFKERHTTNSFKTIQKFAREGKIRGQQIGRRSWLFHEDAVRDFLMRPGR